MIDSIEAQSDMVAQCTGPGTSPWQAFRANGIVTLTTDFGLREPFVGIMKGVMLAHSAQLNFVDRPPPGPGGSGKAWSGRTRTRRRGLQLAGAL